jgi:VanZ family protein
LSAGARRRALRWAPVIAWMAAIFFLSSVERLPGAGTIPDWLSHGVAYGAGAVLIARALAADGASVTLPVAVLATLLATLYGVTDEYHQSFVPGRTAEVADVVKDGAGAALFALVESWRASRAARLRATEVHP